MMSRRLGFCLLLMIGASLLQLGPRVFADGKVFGRNAVVAESISTPDQRALLHWSNGVERLVIETSFLGEGTNFAWLIPFPSEPLIEAVSTNFFRNLQISFQPLVIDGEPLSALFRITLLGLGALGFVEAVRRKRMMDFLAVILLGFLLFGMLLPTLGPAGSSSPSSEQVDLLHQAKVGVYEVAVLRGVTGEAVLQWLSRHGYHAPTNALETISQYAKENWVFVAARLARDETGTIKSRPTPLAFTFATAQAIYPLRLTGQQKENCSIDLYVFGPSRAKASGFETVHAGPPNWQEGANALWPTGDRSELRAHVMPPRPGNYRVANHEARKFAAPAPWVTKLSGDLAPASMRADAIIHWVDADRKLHTVHSLQGALSQSCIWGGGFLFMGLMVAQLTGRRFGRRNLARLIACVLLGSVSLAAAKFASCEIVPVTLSSRSHAIVREHRVERLAELVGMVAEEHTQGDFVTALLKTGQTTSAFDSAINAFTGKPIKEEASPGNLLVDRGASGLTVYWHDINDNPVQLWPRASANTRKQP